MLISRWPNRINRFLDGNLCSFGITETIAAGLIAAGVGEGVAAVAAPALLGAAGGAAFAGATGGDPLLGAAGGAFTGGAIGGFGGIVGDATGLGLTGGSALVGAGSGAAFAGATGGDPLKGALSGGVSGLISGLTSGGGQGGMSPGEVNANIASTPATGAAGGSAPVSPAPPGVSSALSSSPIDLTSGVQFASASPQVSLSDAGGYGGSGPVAPDAASFALRDILPGAGLGSGAPTTINPFSSDASFGSAPGGGVAPSADASGLAGGGFEAPGASGVSIRPDVPGSFGPGGGAAAGPSTSFDLGGATANLPDSFGASPNIQPALGSSLQPPLGSGGAVPGGTGTQAQPGFIENALTKVGVGPETARMLSKGVGPAIAGGGLLYSLTNANSGPNGAADVNKLQGTADSLSKSGSGLVNDFLSTGQLPPGAQAAVTQATNAAKAKVRSSFASLGLSGSSMEMQALATVDSNAAAQVYDIGSKLMQTGLDQTKLASDLYSKIIGIDAAQTSQTGAAISNFAAALAGPSIAVRLAA